MPNLHGVLETSLYVEDLKRSVAFYKALFGFETLAADDRFCALNVSDRYVLLLFRKGASSEPMKTAGGTIPPHDGGGQLHLAFSISKGDLEEWERRLGEQGVSIESKVVWERGGTSIYFRDADGHLIELVTPGLWSIY